MSMLSDHQAGDLIRRINAKETIIVLLCEYENKLLAS